MKTYHNDPAIKEKYINRVKSHREADELIQGIGWENGKGCAVGCTLEVYSHGLYPIEIGIPEWLAYLEDHIFEVLPNEEALKWPEQFLEAIPLNIDEIILTKVRDRFQIFWLERQKTQIDCIKYPKVENAIDRVILLLNRALNNDEPTSETWATTESAARSAARSAACSAARSAAYSAARSAARSAACSAARSAACSAARSAVWATAWTTAKSEARSEALVKRDWLLAELRALK